MTNPYSSRIVKSLPPILLALVLLLLIPVFTSRTKAASLVNCGWECSGSVAVCKPGGDVRRDLGYGCECHQWCSGNGTKVSDVAPCTGSTVSCSGQWNWNQEGCCDPPVGPPPPTTPPVTPPPVVPSGNIRVDPTSGDVAAATFCNYDVYWTYNNAPNARVTYKHSDQTSETTWCGGSASSCNNWGGHAGARTLAGKSTEFRLYNGTIPLSGPATFTCNVAPYPSCSVALNPSQFDVQVGQSQSIAANVGNLQGVVESVAFSSQEPFRAYVYPPTDTIGTDGYTSLVTGVTSSGGNNVPITARVYMRGGPYTNYEACTATANVNVTEPPANSAWWQVKDSDVIANGGAISSRIPDTCNSTPGCYPYFGREGNDVPGLYPGIVMHSGGSLNFSSGQISRDTVNEGWDVSAAYRGRYYNFKYFDDLVSSKVPASKINTIAANSTITGFSLSNPDANGYNWFRVTGGSLTIASDINLQGNKVILLVDGSLNINGRINFNKGRGFFMVVTRDDINISSSVASSSGPALEGLFLASGQFVTREPRGADTTPDGQLHIRGMVAATGGGVILRRDLDPGLTNRENNSKPAELFEFAPDLYFRVPLAIARTSITWKEISP